MRNLIFRPSLLILMICVISTGLVFAGQSQQPSGSKQAAATTADTGKNTAAEAAVNQMVEKIVAREAALAATMKGMHPLVETYIQTLDKDDELAFHPTGDQYFLGKLQFNPGSIKEKTFLNDSMTTSIFGKMKQVYSVKYLPEGFEQMLVIGGHFDRNRYNVGKSNAQNELTALVVDTDTGVKDSVDEPGGMTPVGSLRAWERQAEDNVIQRMEKAGLIAPDGEVNKVLETVLTNLEVTNNLDILPEIRARVLLTSPLESFTIGHTIVLSRGLVDVLPDEASLAMVLAHELAHIALGHRLDTKYAFNDRMLSKIPRRSRKCL